MQTLQTPSLRSRAASVRRGIEIVGKAVCSGCGGETFEIAIYGPSDTEAVCANGECRKMWPPTGQGSGKNSGVLKAVAD